MIESNTIANNGTVFTTESLVLALATELADGLADMLIDALPEATEDMPTGALADALAEEKAKRDMLLGVALFAPTEVGIVVLVSAPAVLESKIEPTKSGSSHGNVSSSVGAAADLQK